MSKAPSQLKLKHSREATPIQVALPTEPITRDGLTTVSTLLIFTSALHYHPTMTRDIRKHLKLYVVKKQFVV